MNDLEQSLFLIVTSGLSVGGRGVGIYKCTHVAGEKARQ